MKMPKINLYNLLLLIPLLCLTLAAAVIDWTKPRQHTLIWDYTNEVTGDLSFNVYSSTNVAVPLANWQLFTNCALSNLTMKTSIGTNGFATNTFYLTFQQVPQLNFFAVKTYSGFYGGESDFSNVTNTPAAPQSSRALRIQ